MSEPSLPNLRVYVHELERTCVYCGCTDTRACLGGCCWVEKHPATPTGVCSQCRERQALSNDELRSQVRSLLNSHLNKETLL